jgi:excisionase family DNA binding protein
MENAKECWSSPEKTVEHIGINKDTIRNWIEKGVIPAYKVGKQWKFKISEIDEWIRSGESTKIVE